MVHQLLLYILYKKKVDFLFLSKNIRLLINIYIVLFKVISLRHNILLPTLFPILEAVLMYGFWYSLSSFSDAGFSSSIVAKFHPFMLLFSFGSRRKLRATKSGECGGWGMTTNNQWNVSSRIIVVQYTWLVVPHIDWLMQFF